MGTSSCSSSGVITTTVFMSVLCFCFSVYGSKSYLMEERTALLQLRDSLNYPNGTALDQWVGHNYCDWQSISCDSAHNVISIYLLGDREFRLGKWYPNASLFTHFKKLQSLYLPFNNIGGWIMPQALCELRNLRSLNLSGNYLDNGGLPRCLARGLPFLEEVVLNKNSLNLSSPLLSALCGLENLRQLHLGYNVLSNGSLPPCMLDVFSSLKSLDLSYFSLEESSNVLTALRGARNLRELILEYNNFSDGTMEALCGVIRNLKTLDLNYINLNVQRIPPCLQQNHSSLENLYLSGITPTKDSKALLKGLSCGWKKLRVLDLYDNDLSDEDLPSCLFYNSSVLEELYLSSNSLGGSLRLTGLSCGWKKLRVLDLYDNDLSDEDLPSCLFYNSSVLEELDLSSNNLRGSLGLSTGLCGWKKLRMLDLGYNDLSDEDLPSCLFYNSSVLETLDLSSNNLRGSHGLSTGLCKLRKLRMLFLDMNSMQNVPWTCLSQMNSLDTLDLSGNQIVGIVPPAISNLTSLRFLVLSENKLEGVTFFSMFANLSKLELIDLSNNRDLEVETESPTWIPTFQLQSLYLDNCKLRTIPHFLGTQHNLYELSLAYNSLQGTIPSWLLYNATLDYSNLLLRGNQFHGPLPLPFKNETSLVVYLDISDNNFQGELPRNINVFFPILRLLNMSRNKFQGCIPPSFGSLINLRILDLSNNYFVGEVPHRLTQNNTSLLHLVLSRNNLHAMPRVSNLTNLRTLSLDSNLFTRPFLITPSSVPSLVLLDISGNSMFGNIQDWLLPIAFPNLMSLLMRENHFVGYLPPSLCQMCKLRVLDLSNNNISGTIPSCINNITSWLKESEVDDFFGFGVMWVGEESTYNINFATKGKLHLYEGGPLHGITGIDLSLNRLVGDIPSQMGKLRALHSLNFSHNSLTGYLPESFQELKQVESLDLSHNKLVGVIPPQMIQLSFLSTFSVAFNQLSGRIPFERNFATFTKESYMGNLGLCGPPIEVNCSSPQSHHNEHKEGDDEEQSLLDNHLFFYSYVAICFLLGFWAVVAPLILSRNWRLKYYKIVDRCIDWCSDRIFWFLYYIKNH